MASNFTCRACSKALSRSSTLSFQTSIASQTNYLSKPSQSSRTLSTTPSRSAQPAPPRKPQTISQVLGRDEPKRDTKTRTPAAGIAQKLRENVPMMTETYVAYGVTEKMLKECARPGDYQIPQALEKKGEIPEDEKGVHVGVGSGWWYETLGLQPNFNNWAQITFIHMFMLQVRFRMFPTTHASTWIQHLTNHAFYAAEDRLVVWHKLHSATVRQKFLKDAFAQWRGVLLAYDEGLVKGDAMLAAAVWRNLFGGREDVDFEKLAMIVGYMRKELARLVKASDNEVAMGEWQFEGDPGDEANTLSVVSKLMKDGASK